MPTLPALNGKSNGVVRTNGSSNGVVRTNGSAEHKAELLEGLASESRSLAASEFANAGPDIVTALRRAGAAIPLAEALTTTGAAMVCGGVCWGMLRFFRAHPDVLVVIAGLLIFVAGLASCQNGLLFVQTVFKSSIIELLPQGVSRVLLPEPPEAHSHSPEEVSKHSVLGPSADGTSSEPTASCPPKTPRDRWRNAGQAMIAARRLRSGGGRAGSPAKLTGEHFSEISEVLRTKSGELQEKLRLSGEPELHPLILSMVRDALPGKRVVLQALSALSACAASCWLGTWAVLVRSKPAQQLLLSGFSLLGIGRGGGRDVIVRRSARCASVLGMLSIGCSVVLFGRARRERLLAVRPAP